MGTTVKRDSVTLRLQGEAIPLEAFARGVSKMVELLNALRAEIAPDAQIDWTVSGLERSSAIATASGYSPRAEAVEKIVLGYQTVGQAVEARRPVPYSQRVATAAHGITGLVSGAVTGVVFETIEGEWSVLSRGPAMAPPPAAYTALGAVTGRIQTLTNRGGLRFILFDLIEDRAISCYLADGREGIMRDAWGRIAIVEGLVRRDARGRPMSVRQITDLTLRAERSPDSYLDARGAAPSLLGLRPEDAIRRVRDV